MAILLEIFPQELIQQFFIQLSSCVRLIVSGLIFFYPLQKKRMYPARLALALALCALALAGTVWLRYSVDTIYTRAFMRFTQFCMPLLIVLLTRDGSTVSRLKVLCASIGATEIGLAVFSVLVTLTGGDERETISLFHSAGEYNTNWLDWLIFFGVNTLVYFALFRLFHYEKYEELDKKSTPSTVVLTVFCLLVLTVPDCLRSEFSPDSYAHMLLYRLYLVAISIFILLYSNEITFRSRYRTEKEIMDQVLSEERKQYLQLKENIDVINMRCHDLKHQLDDFSGRLTDRELEELRGAMDFYDSNIKTGSEVLDVVLRIAQLTCEKEHIQLSCLADGSSLGFMRTRHVYSLFNNALSNAIEAVRKLPDPEKRVISLFVERRGSSVEIEVTNYFDGVIAAPGGTTKADSHRHGFGTMSMRYVAEEYGGSCSVRTTRDIFTLNISIPVPAAS